MRYSLRLKFVLAYFFFYMCGFSACAWFAVTGNKFGTILSVVLPVVLVLAYCAWSVHVVAPAPAKKKLPVRRASVARRNVKVVR